MSKTESEGELDPPTDAVTAKLQRLQVRTPAASTSANVKNGKNESEEDSSKHNEPHLPTGVEPPASAPYIPNVTVNTNAEVADTLGTGGLDAGCSVMVRQLPLSLLTGTVLLDICRRYGEVTSIQFPRASELSSVALVTFAARSSALAAASELDQAKFDQQPIRAQVVSTSAAFPPSHSHSHSQPLSPSQSMTGSWLSLVAVPHHFSRDLLKAMFAEFGPVLDCVINEDRTASVRMQDHGHAMIARAQLDSTAVSDTGELMHVSFSQRPPLPSHTAHSITANGTVINAEPTMQFAAGGAMPIPGGYTFIPAPAYEPLATTASSLSNNVALASLAASPISAAMFGGFPSAETFPYYAFPSMSPHTVPTPVSMNGAATSPSQTAATSYYEPMSYMLPGAGGISGISAPTHPYQPIGQYHHRISSTGSTHSSSSSGSTPFTTPSTPQHQHQHAASPSLSHAPRSAQFTFLSEDSYLPALATPTPPPGLLHSHHHHHHHPILLAGMTPSAFVAASSMISQNQYAVRPPPAMIPAQTRRQSLPVQHSQSSYHSQSQHHHSRPGVCLFVFHLPPRVTDGDLYELFTPFGTVVSCKVMTNPSTNLSKGYGFVNYQHPHEAQAAIVNMHGHPIDNKFLKVQLKKRRDNHSMGNISAIVNGTVGGDSASPTINE